MNCCRLSASKTREMLECRGVNIWMIQGDESLLLLMHQSGSDPTTWPRHDAEGAGQGIAGDVSDNGEPTLIENVRG